LLLVVVVLLLLPLLLSATCYRWMQWRPSCAG
jgi:hypothetical protein